MVQAGMTASPYPASTFHGQFAAVAAAAAQQQQQQQQSQQQLQPHLNSTGVENSLKMTPGDQKIDMSQSVLNATTAAYLHQRQQQQQQQQQLQQHLQQSMQLQTFAQQQQQQQPQLQSQPLFSQLPPPPPPPQGHQLLQISQNRCISASSVKSSQSSECESNSPQPEVSLILLHLTKDKLKIFFEFFSKIRIFRKSDLMKMSITSQHRATALRHVQH